MSRLVAYVRVVLTKRRLESFELAVTSLEDSVSEVLYPVVEMICDVLPKLAHNLKTLILALELESQQVFLIISFVNLVLNVFILGHSLV